MLWFLIHGYDLRSDGALVNNEGLSKGILGGTE